MPQQLSLNIGTFGHQPTKTDDSAQHKVFVVRGNQAIEAVSVALLSSSLGQLEVGAWPWQPRVLAQIGRPLPNSMRTKLRSIVVAAGHVRLPLLSARTGGSRTQVISSSFSRTA